MKDEELDRLLATRERPVPLRPLTPPRRSRPSRVLGAVALAAAVVVGALAGTRLGELRDNAAASPTPSPGATPPGTTPAGTASPAVASAPANSTVVENSTLGYRLTLPAEGYRRSSGTIWTKIGSRGGVDMYTLKTEQELRDECRQDLGHVGPGNARPTDLRVTAHIDVGGMSAYEWVTTPRVSGGGTLADVYRVERTSVAGQEAVRLLRPAGTGSSETALYVIRASGRIYEIAGAFGGGMPGPPAGWLDGIAQTFTALAPGPLPTPRPQDARSEAQAFAAALARSFAAKDADAVGTLMPPCHISAVHTIEGEVVGMGPLNRAVPLFTEGLRAAFAGGAVVTVDTSLRPEPRWGEDVYAVSSEWREPGRRPVRTSLLIAEQDGRWIWAFASIDLARGESQCAYPTPWHRPPSAAGLRCGTP